MSLVSTSITWILGNLQSIVRICNYWKRRASYKFETVAFFLGWLRTKVSDIQPSGQIWLMAPHNPISGAAFLSHMLYPTGSMHSAWDAQCPWLPLTLGAGLCHLQHPLWPASWTSSGRCHVHWIKHVAGGGRGGGLWTWSSPWTSPVPLIQPTEFDTPDIESKDKNNETEIQ